jgi:hypothetical protein
MKEAASRKTEVSREQELRSQFFRLHRSWVL